MAWKKWEAGTGPEIRFIYPRPLPHPPRSRDGRDPLNVPPETQTKHTTRCVLWARARCLPEVRPTGTGRKERGVLAAAVPASALSGGGVPRFFCCIDLFS